MKRRTWMERTLAGHVVAIDDEIAAWHNGDENEAGRSLPDFLGMTGEGYALFVEKPHALPAIVARRLSRAAAEVVTLDDPLQALQLSGRAERALLAAGITSVRTVVALHAATLLKIPGFGAGCLSDVRASLARHGLALAGEGVR